MSCRQPQPLGQCCSLCNATDWADIPWNSTVSSPWSKLAAAGGVQLLQPAAVTSTSSLADVVSSGLLPRVCDSKETCSSDVRWQLSDWSSCSKKCGGGVRRRTASCINTQSGTLAWLCTFLSPLCQCMLILCNVQCYCNSTTAYLRSYCICCCRSACKQCPVPTSIGCSSV